MRDFLVSVSMVCLVVCFTLWLVVKWSENMIFMQSCIQSSLYFVITSLFLNPVYLVAEVYHLVA